MADLASAQHGAISIDQLGASGLTPSQIKTARRNGWLRAAASGVVVIAGSPATIERSLAVGLLCLGQSAIVSHEAAGRLHRFDRCRADAVEFTMPRRRRGCGAGLAVHTTETLGVSDRVTIDGFPCTSVTRTILDLARARIGRVRLEAAIDSAVRSGASSPIVLSRRLAELRGPGQWGVRLLGRLLVDSGGHSMLERRFLQLVRRAGLPRPQTQVVHRVGTRTVARVDFCFDHGIVVEVTGRLGHSSDAERRRDAQRRNELQAIGRQVFEYTWRDVTERPEYVANSLGDRLADAERFTDACVETSAR